MRGEQESRKTASLRNTEIEVDRGNKTALLLEGEINTYGLIPFSRVHDLALYGPDGDYSTGRVGIGSKDFITFPEKTPYFGQVIATRILEIWGRMGKPKRFDIVEAGAGNGTLAQYILLEAEKGSGDFYHSIHYTIVEHSEGLIRKQKEKLADQEKKVQWIYQSATDPLPSFRGVLLSNELVDAFPVEVVKRSGGRVLQKYVGIKKKRWIEVWKDASEEVMDFIHAYGVNIYEDVEEAINPGSVLFQRNADEALNQGAIITIDYGSFRENGKKGVPAVWLEGGKRDIFGRTVGELYEQLGNIDITSRVNFSPLILRARMDRMTISSQEALPEYLLTPQLRHFLSLENNRIYSLPTWEELVSASGYYNAFIQILNMSNFQVLAVEKGLPEYSKKGKRERIKTEEVLPIVVNIGSLPQADVSVHVFENIRFAPHWYRFMENYPHLFHKFGVGFNFIQLQADNRGNLYVPPELLEGSRFVSTVSARKTIERYEIDFRDPEVYRSMVKAFGYQIE